VRLGVVPGRAHNRKSTLAAVFQNLVDGVAGGPCGQEGGYNLAALERSVQAFADALV
jgi:hypothetical protein